jgi:hypothetical protein
MSATLESRLRDSGVACRVEVRERLVILVPDGEVITRDDRMQMIQLARAEGFTHVCVELHPDGAPLPGD